MTDICNICCDKFNKSINTKIICPISTCKLEACKKCKNYCNFTKINIPYS